MASTLLAVDPNDYSDKLNTELSAEDEATYQQWAKDNNRTKDVYDFDMRGQWKAGLHDDSPNGHIGDDRFKKPNHPTFSNESNYSGGDTVGGKWSENAEGKTVFTPSEHNLKNMSKDELKSYFDEYEKGVILNIPESIAKKLYPNQEDH